MTSTTWIKNADWIIAWDAATGGHKYIRNGDLGFSGSEVTFVGRGYSGVADTTVDGADLMVMPGILNLHIHAYGELHGKGFYEDLASRHLWMSQLYEYTFVLQGDDESALAATQASICELLESGCTTFAELYEVSHWFEFPFPNWLETLAQSGIRTYACPMVASGRWYTPDGKQVLYEWYDTEKVEKNFANAMALIDEAENPQQRPAQRYGWRRASRHLHGRALQEM